MILSWIDDYMIPNIRQSILQVFGIINKNLKNMKKCTSSF